MVGQPSHGSQEPPQGPGLGPVSSTSALHPRAASRQGRQGRNVTQNDVVPPVEFPGGRNPYLERPLPPPPPPKTPKGTVPVTALAPPPAPALLARPSTSSGPSPTKTAMSRPNFEKRLSKDDMSLSGQMGMSMGRTKGGYQAYRLGMRSNGLPTPEPSPDRMPSPPLLSSIPSRMPTPNSISSGEIQIGMALGSPTTYAPSPLAGWQPQQQMQQQTQPSQLLQTFTPPRDTYSPLTRQRTPEPTIQRQKTQKRKFFGSLFGIKKQVEPAKTPEPFDTNYTTFATISNSSLHRSGETTPLRSNTVSAKKTSKSIKPTLARSRTETDMENAVDEARTKMPDLKPANIQTGPVAISAPVLSLGGPGFLDVEIPDIRLERYSIMFSGVLNPQGAGNRNSSSLLARRQATLEKLKNINDKIVDEETEGNKSPVRRSPSPQVSKSPAFSLFPPPPQIRQTGVSPRLRSNTSPALLSSPSRTSFDTNHAAETRLRKEAKRVTIISPRTMDERNRAANVEKLREQQIQMQKAEQARSAAHTFGPEESALFLDSPQSDVSDVEEIIPRVDSLPLRPRIQEPQWEIISPPSTSSPSETSSTTTKRTTSTTSSSASSVQTNVTRPSMEKSNYDDDDGEDAALKAAVEISIARQISISRQQRNLLRTTTTTGLPASNGAPKMMMRSVSARVTPLGNGLPNRVIETKQSMPRLVDMHRNQYRKSERVVLEAA